MSLIFGVVGIKDTDIADRMFKIMSFRSNTGTCRTVGLPMGFIADADMPESASEPGYAQAVLDGYIGDGQNKPDSSGITILHRTFSEYGSSGFEHIFGSYAAAYWDPENACLYLVRDPAGSRPLYYSVRNGILIFASSPKGILASGHVESRLNPAAVSLYMSMIGVPDPVCIFKHIHALQSGCFLRFQNADAQIHRYWTPPWIGSNDALPQEDEMVHDLRIALESSVRDAIPENAGSTCFFLSGGTDTSTVVGLTASQGIQPIHTYTIGYGGMGGGYADYNEFDFAKLVSERFNTIHRETTFSPLHVLSALPRIISHLDQPSGDAINSFLVSGSVNQKHSVALTGTGGDEIFIGSQWYTHQLKLIRLLNRWNTLPSLLRNVSWTLTSFFPFLPLARKLKALKALEDGVPAQYRHIKLLYGEDEMNRLFTPSFRSDGKPERTVEDIINLYDDQQSGCDDLNRMCGLLLQHEVTNIQLRDLDTMCHANRLESRSPLLDRRILDVLARVPGSMKAPDGNLRHLMFTALQDILPSETLSRRKMSFIVPMDLWARRELKPVIDRATSPGVLRKRGIFNPEAVASEYRIFYRDGNRHSFKLWLMVMLEIWCRVNIDQPVGTSPPEKLIEIF
ncbi:hypothetical protein JXA40_01015 [bacterium]|nr:hypothetical protein [candidate division CSSED10-310 bacterium]